MTAHKDLEQRIINWSIWAKSSLKAPVSCRSLESRYKSPQHWHAEQARMPIDILDAVEIEKAIIKLPRPQLNIIVYAYIRSGYDFNAFCSKNRIHGTKLVSKTEQFKIDQLRAETMLRNILYKNIDRFNIQEYIYTHNLTPVRESVAVTP
jgi:hypothetical protein